jgi:hypothetical protein
MTETLSQSLKSPIFIVGCPRSGTTLLQSLLLAHPEIASFPESHFFVRLIKNRNIFRYALGIAAPAARPRFQQFLQEIEREEMQKYLPKSALFLPQYSSAFIQVLNRLTQEQGCSFWVEKTPDHLLYIKYIEKLVTNAKFIHLIRNGEDVIASLYEVTHKYPRDWLAPWSIEKCINKWNDAVRASYGYLNKANHCFIRYENLIVNPDLTLDKISKFLEISFDSLVLQRRSQEVSQIILKNEPWKNSVAQEIIQKKDKKFNEIFDEEQKQYILKKIATTNSQQLTKIFPEP